MTRTEAIAQAIADELLSMASQINATKVLRGISFDVKIKPGTITVRSVVVRPEFERVLHVNGD